MLTVEEVADRLRVSKMTVYRLCIEGTIPSVRVGRSYRIEEADFTAYLTGLRQPVQLKDALFELAASWEARYAELVHDHEENDPSEEIDDAIADTYLVNAQRLRALLKEHA